MYIVYLRLCVIMCLLIQQFYTFISTEKKQEETDDEANGC